ncbi:MAG: DUF504 domain-containing protein [Candidatus Lokiarchaeota archaeon]|nr:DUF504 domain-containing protein [Candidatus Lokiarchaeota archaeon]
MTRKNPLVEILDKILWHMPAEQRDRITITITHRGARNDMKAIPMADIARIDKGYIYITKQEGNDGMDDASEVSIPLHRVITIVDGEGVLLYDKGMTGKKE